MSNKKEETFPNTGDRFGNWTYLRPGERKRYWVCRCDCGTEVEVYAYNAIEGKSKQCHLCHSRNIQKLNKVRKYKVKPAGEVGFRKILHSYKKQAENRGLSFDLSPEEFRSITSSDCYYCGAKPGNSSFSQTGYSRPDAKEHTLYLYNGIDRVNNDIGYETSNTVPCCFVCNRAKSKMSQLEFASWLSQAYVCFCEGKSGK